jgi:hypothetical protein
MHCGTPEAQYLRAVRGIVDDESPSSLVVDVTISEAYATLGLDASSTTPDEARSRFRDLIRSNHPDGKPSHEHAQANDTTRVIVEACVVLRAAGFLHVMAGNRTADAGGRRNERTTDEAHSSELYAWLDELWRECFRGNLICFAPPLFSIRFSLEAWTMGWEIMSCDPTRFK